MPMIATASLFDETEAPAPEEPRQPFVPSPQQADFLRVLNEGNAHIILEARAGTGKTRTCREGILALPRSARTVYCAFNKHIAQEFNRIVPANCRAATLHTHGKAALHQHLDGADVILNADKILDLAEKYFKGKFGPDKDARYAIKKLASICKSQLIDTEDIDGLAEVAAQHDIDLGDHGEDVLGVIAEVLDESLRMTAQIDFDDMIWMPLKLGLTFTSCDVLFIDEAQDLDPAQHALALQMAGSGQIVVAGDRFQSIYAFRGADADSIPRFEAILSATSRGLERLPLTVTRRCPTRHVALAQRLVPDIEALNDAPDGEILHIQDGDAALGRLGPGDLVLCRTNAPLLGACYHLLRSGRRAFVRGRDIGKGLLALVARLRARTTPDLIGRLEDFRIRELARLSELRHPEPAIAALQDKVDCLKSISEGTAEVAEIRARIETLFTDLDSSNAVTFSSVHRAKGLEAERVSILAPQLLPHPLAKTTTAKAQEVNIAYVAVTRSKQRLEFFGPTPPLFGA